MPAEPAVHPEIEQRHNKVRAFLEKQNLGALFAYSPPMEHKWGQTGHVSYLSGWANHDRIVDSAVVIPSQGRPSLLVAGLPYMLEQIADVSPLTDLRLVRAVDPQAVAVAPGQGVSGQAAIHDFASETLAILRENGSDGKDVGVVGVENMAMPFYEGLSRGLAGKFKRVADIVAKLRSVKSPFEIARMKRAAHLSDLGFQTMLRMARPGMRGLEVVAEMERVVRREGADHAKYWMASGPPSDWSATRLDIKPHERVLQGGDLMASCSYVVYKGYWCHGHRTGTLQARCPELEALCTIAREAQEAGLEKLKPGEPVGEIARAISRRAAKQGFELLGGRIGHGMGTDYSELPNLAESNESLLESGMTAVIHATFALPGSGKMFVPLGDVCHVTPDGPDFLMEFPRTPFVAG
jgi:Xaa-Pro dipeptidase